MRFRRTAPPSAFLMLHPNRLISRPFARRKTLNSRLERRRPSRYTASYSPRRTRRHSRGKSSRGKSDARETVAPFPAALRKDFSSTLALHACAEAVLLMAAAHMRLKRAFRQRSFSSASILVCSVARGCRSGFSPSRRISSHVPAKQSQIADLGETVSLVDPQGTVKEGAKMGRGETRCHFMSPKGLGRLSEARNH